MLQGMSKVDYYITPVQKSVSWNRFLWPCLFRGDRQSAASLIKLFYCSGNLAETLSGPSFIIDTVLWHTKLMIHCLLSEHASILSCRKPLHALYKHQEPMPVSVLQRHSSEPGRLLLLYLTPRECLTSYICLCRHSCSAYPWHRQVSSLTLRKFLHRQNCGTSRKRWEHISVSGTVFMKITLMWCYESLSAE